MMNKQQNIDTLLTQFHKLSDEIAALDIAQSSFKVGINSFYGVLGLAHFKYYDYRLAEAVTSTGQVFIKKTMQVTNEILNTILKTEDDYVLASDTDSVYFRVEKIVDILGKDKTKHEIVNILEKFVFDVLQPTLNKKLTTFAKTMGISDCKIFYKLECIGDAIIFVAKKRYAFDILYSEGIRYAEPKMKVMGIEIVRSSTPNVVKSYLKEALTLCLRTNEPTLQKKVRDVKQSFMKESYWNISFPRGINGLSTYGDNASIYKKGCPIQVRGALVYNHTLTRLGIDSKYPRINDGDKVKFVALKMPNPLHESVIAFPSRLPNEMKIDQYVDYKVQFEKAFLAPLENILDAIGWEAEEKVKLDFD
jgi:DNA polymerase elongation subunit (family B)